MIDQILHSYVSPRRLLWLQVLVVIFSCTATIHAQQTWYRLFDFFGDSDIGESIVDPGDGHFVIAGFTYNSAYWSDMLLVDISETGQLSWFKTYNHPALSQTDKAHDIARTLDGGFILAGYAQDGLDDIWVVKTDRQGEVQWDYRFGNRYDIEVAYSIIQNQDSSYVLAGWKRHFEDRASDELILLKLPPQGQELEWVKFYGGINQNGAIGYDLIGTNDGEYLVVGSKGSRAWLVKTDAAGDTLWTKTFSYGESTWSPKVIPTIDGHYLLLIRVADWNPVYDNDFILFKIDRNGDSLWQTTVGTSASEWGMSVAVCRDGGYLAVGGEAAPPGSDLDILLYKLDAGGGIQWKQTYGSPQDDLADDVVETANGDFVLMGYQFMPSPQSAYDLFVMKTDSNGIFVTSIELENSVITDFNLSQNYPNPFNPTTTIQYTLPKAEQATLKIYTITGQEVRTLVSQLQSPGEYSVVWDGTDKTGKPLSSGVYIYRLQAGDEYVQSRKMVLLR